MMRIQFRRAFAPKMARQAFLILEFLLCTVVLVHFSNILNTLPAERANACTLTSALKARCSPGNPQNTRDASDETVIRYVTISR